MTTEIKLERDGLNILFCEPKRDATGWLERYRVYIETDGLTATVSVENPPYGTTPTRFFGELAKNWRGWKGELTWSAMEDELRLTAVSDSTGHITITAQIHPDICPSPWLARASVEVDAGELEQLERRFDAFFAYDAQPAAGGYDREDSAKPQP